MPAAMPKSGDRVNNYLLEEVVGSGSFAQVWRARHHILDQTVAVKILTDPQYVRNFRQEGVVAHGLSHPNIVRVMDIDPYADWPYLIMEYVDGPTLRKLIDDHAGGLPIDQSLRIMRGVLTGLSVAHQAGLIHRDVKPPNILLRTPVGGLNQLGEGDVKLGDFGLGTATTVTTSSLMQSGSLVTEEGRSIAGTLVYMSPEQRAGREIDGRSDLYSCAVVLFEMLTGTTPAGSDMPSTIRAEIPTFLDDVFRRSYTRLERRFASAEAMLEALRGEVRAPHAGRSAAVQVGPRSLPLPPPGGLGRGSNLCPRCTQYISPDDNFCTNCGAQLVNPVPRCPACRAFASRADRFCIFCGTGLQTAGSA